MLRLVLAGVVLAHGLGHGLFLGPSLRLVDWAGQTSNSWLLTAAVGDGVARGVAAVTWLATMVLFTAGVAGYLGDAAWWRPVTVVAALVSMAGIVVFWDGIASSSAIPAIAFDVVLLIVLLVLHWPATDTVTA